MSRPVGRSKHPPRPPSLPPEGTGQCPPRPLPSRNWAEMHPSAPAFPPPSAMQALRPQVLDFSQPSAPPPSAPRPSSAKGLAGPSELETQINGTTGSYDRTQADAIVVTITEEQGRAIAEHGEEASRAATLLQGMYFKIGMHGSSPIFRQEPSSSANSAQLFAYQVARPLSPLTASVSISIIIIHSSG